MDDLCKSGVPLRKAIAMGKGGKKGSKGSKKSGKKSGRRY